MRWVALFSGQGGQRAHHAQALAAGALEPARHAAWRDALASAGAQTDSLDDVALARNRVAQPTVCAWQLNAWRQVAAALPPPVLVAGYSVGELAACAAAGGFADATAIALAAARARIMDEAAPVPSGLAAVLGLGEAQLAAVCAETGAMVAIRNGPRHVVVGGIDAAITACLAAATARGASHAQRLCVNTPAHTALLASAVPRFAAALTAAMGMTKTRGPLRPPMLTGVDGSTLRTAAEAADALARQLATALDWAACMETIAELHPDAVLEIGPGDALARMFAEAAPEIPVRALDAFRSPAAAAAWVLRQGTPL